jgi:hypothetical protein
MAAHSGDERTLACNDPQAVAYVAVSFLEMA